MGYHFQADVVSRGKGHSMVAKAAYNSRESITEERTGEVKDYSRHKDRPLASFVFADAPELRDPGTLWNFYDAHETRKNAQLGYSFIGALPHQLTDEQRANIVKDFAREQFLRKGVAAQADIHRPDRHGDDRNFHVHFLASMREVNKDGLGERVFTWDDREKNLARWHEKWAERTARELEKAGFEVEAERWRYGHLTNQEQREKALQRGDTEWADIKAQAAGHHLGPKASAMQRRGEQSDRANLDAAARQLNDLAARLEAIDARIREEKEKLGRPPKTPEDARERAADQDEGLTRGMRARNRASDPLRRDGYSWWERAASLYPEHAYDAGEAFREYWRKHIWGEREPEDAGGLER